MEEFLKTVARHYRDKARVQTADNSVKASLALSRCLFCFTSRRSGLFFARHLQEAFNEGTSGAMQPCCVPAITTIDSLYSYFSDRQVADRTSLLFRLFHNYDQLSKRRDCESFDQFVFWGDMLLGDFEDADRYLVDADMLFANVRDLKEIEARFSSLTPEQIAIIRSFWQNFRPEQEYPEGDKHEVFGQTWAILAPLYHNFRRDLAADNLAYGGMREREAVDALYGEHGDELLSKLPFDKVVFVGLTAVTQVDRKLMSKLQLNHRAEFCWDYADPRLKPQGSKATSAAYFSRANLNDFPNELSDEELERGLVAESDREVRLFSVSSGVGQTQLANRILRHWQQTIPGFDPLRTAVVLPDEKLLLPMLYAVPKSFDKFNVTMGYSLKTTPIASLVSKLAALQQSWRSSDHTFYFRQVLPILTHPYVVAMMTPELRSVYDDIIRNNEYRVKPERFAADPFLSLLFKPVGNARTTLTYLLTLLEQLMQRAARDVDVHDDDAEPEPQQLELDFDSPGTDLPAERIRSFADTDYEFLYHFHKTVLELERQVIRGNVNFTSKTLFLLLDKLVAGVSVPFSGEPLNGLQVMGVLETRSLDFDNVIILSMNEGTFPAKPSQNSFVPMSLRDAFGMPTQRHRDSIFAYHFYRLIGRAKRLYMIYDSRTDGMQTGEESRYVKQLRYLMGHDQLVAETISEDVGIYTPETFSVAKTPEVLKLLSECLEGIGERTLSASMLKLYIKCPVRFYLNFVRRLNEEEDLSEGIDSATFGNILHKVMHDLYEPFEGQTIQASTLQDFIDHHDRKLMPLVLAAFHEYMGIDQLTGYNQLISEVIIDYLVETLRHDMGCCPFDYFKGECRQVLTLPLGDGRNVRFMCVYDRLDQPLSAGGAIRIVDYKTGNSSKGSKLLFPTVEDLFLPDGHGSSEAFQVALYALLLEKAKPAERRLMNIPEGPLSIAPHLYFVRDFKARQKVSTSLAIGSGKKAEPIADFSPLRDEFMERLETLFAEIFNPDVSFHQCEDTQSCRYCPYANFCNR